MTTITLLAHVRQEFYWLAWFLWVDLVIRGPLQCLLIDVRNVVIMHTHTLQQVHTCPPAMGFSFAAGTTDGPGAFSFTQGISNNHALIASA